MMMTPLMKAREIKPFQFQTAVTNLSKRSRDGTIGNKTFLRTARRFCFSSHSLAVDLSGISAHCFHLKVFYNDEQQEAGV